MACLSKVSRLLSNAPSYLSRHIRTVTSRIKQEYDIFVNISNDFFDIHFSTVSDLPSLHEISEINRDEKEPSSNNCLAKKILSIFTRCLRSNSSSESKSFEKKKIK